MRSRPAYVTMCGLSPDASPETLEALGHMVGGHASMTQLAYQAVSDGKEDNMSNSKRAIRNRKVARENDEAAAEKSAAAAADGEGMLAPDHPPLKFKALVLDHDAIWRPRPGAIVLEGPDDVLIPPDVPERLAQFQRSDRWVICTIHWVPTLAFGQITLEQVQFAQRLVREKLPDGTIHFQAVCPNHPDGTNPRYNVISTSIPPGTGMISGIEDHFLNNGVTIDLEKSLLVSSEAMFEQMAAAVPMPFEFAETFFGREPLACVSPDENVEIKESGLLPEIKYAAVDEAA